MKIRKHSRILAFALALVTILPLISIPTFADFNGVLFEEQETPPATPTPIFALDFEAETVGKAPTSGMKLALANSVISDTFGSNAWSFDYKVNDTTNNKAPDELNKDVSQTINNPEISHETYEKIVYEVDLFFGPGSTGRLQTQLTNARSAAGDASWISLFCVQLQDGKAFLVTEGGGSFGTALAENSMKLGVWNTVSMVLDMKACRYDLYINGVKVFENVSNMGTKVSTNLVIPEGKFIVTKPNKYPGAGSVQIDNIRFFAGDTPTAEPRESKPYEDFEDYIYSVGYQAGGVSTPSLATYERMDGSIVCRIPMAAALPTDTYTLISADCKKTYASGIVWDGKSNTVSLDTKEHGVENFDLKLDRNNGFYYVTDDSWGDLLTDGKRYYIVPDAVTEIANGGQNIAKASKFVHPTFAYNDAENPGKTVVLSADYFIEHGSKGIVESQFESFYSYNAASTAEDKNERKSWMQIFKVDIATGKMSDNDGQVAIGATETYMKIGQWNNLKLVLNLETGVYQIYLNDTYVAERTVGHGNLTIGKDAGSYWNVAKIQRTNSLESELKGGICIDNVKVEVADPANYVDGEGEHLSYLTKEAELDAYNDVINTLGETTVRFETPNGLRFATEVNTARLEEITETLGATIVDRGTLIAPYDYVLTAGSFNKENLDTLDKDVNYLDVKYVKDFEGAAGFEIDEEDTSKTYMTASIIDIKPENLDRDFAAIAYMTLKVGEKTVTLYSGNFAVANIRGLSAKLIANTAGSDAFTNPQLTILGGFTGNVTVDADLGNKNNPITIVKNNTTAVVNGTLYYQGAFPGEVITVTGPAGFKLLYNDGEITDTLIPNDDPDAEAKGIATIELSTDQTDAITFAIEGCGVYNINVNDPLGSAARHDTLAFGETELHLGTYIKDGYYFDFVPSATGTVEFMLTCEAADVETDLIVMMGTTPYKKMSANGVDGVLSFKAIKNAEYTVHVVVNPGSDDTYPAEADLVLSTAFTASLSKLSDVLAVSGTVSFQIDYSALYVESTNAYKNEATFTGPTGFSVIYNGTTYNDTDGRISFLLADEESVSFKIVGDGSEYTYTFDYPVGSVNKPVSIPSVKNEVASIDLSLEANDADGYYYTWKNPYSDVPGTASFDIATITDGVVADIIVTTATGTFKLSDVTEGALNVTVAASETVKIQVIVIADELTGDRAAADITFTAGFTPEAGTVYNPIVLDATVTSWTVDPGKYYSLGLTGKEITVDVSGLTLVDGETNAEVVYYLATAPDNKTSLYPNATATKPIPPVEEGTGPVIFVVNRGVSGTISLSADIKLGSAANPEEIASLSATATKVAIGAQSAPITTDGYYFKYTATADGTLTFDRTTPITSSANIKIVVTDKATGLELASGVAKRRNPLTVELTAGTEVLIQIWVVNSSDEVIAGYASANITFA
ncbi:MAG: hypothetical protein E7643_00225 [Ruminococcaceae bacterium]|nr:hypothetical protein [Oscillospiraceae bacterium]